MVLSDNDLYFYNNGKQIYLFTFSYLANNKTKYCLNVDFYQDLLQSKS